MTSASGARPRGRQPPWLLATAGRRILFFMLLTILGSYLAIVLLVYLLQDAMLFYPKATAISAEQARYSAERSHGEQLIIAVEPAIELHGFFLPGEGESPRKTIFYFGGNAETIGLGLDEWNPVRAQGWNVALVAYRGYGRSNGSPAAKTILADSLIIHDTVVARVDVDPAHIVVWSRSLGTGVAVHIAANRHVEKLVLISPFARLVDVAAHHYPWLPVRLLMRHRIDSLSLAPSMSTPVLILHGDADIVIPSSESRRLSEAWGTSGGGSARRIVVPRRDHESITLDPIYPEVVHEFIGGKQ